MTFSAGGGSGSGAIYSSTDVALNNPSDGQVLAYDASVSKWKNANGGSGSTQPVSQLATFNQAGALSVKTGTGRFSFPMSATIQGVSAIVGTAPQGASIVIDVLRNGSTIFTTPANRPTIAAGASFASERLPNITSVNAGDYLTVNVAQVGSSTPGSDLTVQIRYS